MDRSNSIIYSPVVVLGGACGFGFGGIVVGTSFGTPVAVALKAPRNPPGRGSVLVVVFNFGLDENILPVKIEKYRVRSRYFLRGERTDLSGILEVSKTDCFCDLLLLGGKD